MWSDLEMQIERWRLASEWVALASTSRLREFTDGRIRGGALGCKPGANQADSHNTHNEKLPRGDE
jgi:hypothetical protein